MSIRTIDLSDYYQFVLLNFTLAASQSDWIFLIDDWMIVQPGYIYFLRYKMLNVYLKGGNLKKG